MQQTLVVVCKKLIVMWRGYVEQSLASTGSEGRNGSDISRNSGSSPPSGGMKVLAIGTAPSPTASSWSRDLKPSAPLKLGGV